MRRLLYTRYEKENKDEETDVEKIHKKNNVTANINNNT